jgi:hypothetical protein
LHEVSASKTPVTTSMTDDPNSVRFPTDQEKLRVPEESKSESGLATTSISDDELANWLLGKTSDGKSKPQKLTNRLMLNGMILWKKNGNLILRKKVMILHVSINL